MLCMHWACLKLRRTEFEELCFINSKHICSLFQRDTLLCFSSLVAVRPEEMAEIVSGLGCAFLAYPARCVHTCEIHEGMSPKSQDRGHQP